MQKWRKNVQLNVCRYITKKNEAWKEVAEIAGVFYESTKLVQLARFVNLICQRSFVNQTVCIQLLALEAT